MRTEQRTVYISDDGKEFDSEHACKVYERTQSLSEAIANLIYNGTSLSIESAEEAAGIVAEKIITIIAVYDNL